MSGCGNGEEDEAAEIAGVAYDLGATAAADYFEEYEADPERGIRPRWAATAREEALAGLRAAGVDEATLDRCREAWDEGFYGEDDDDEEDI